MFSGVIFLDENKMWERFCENGKIADYLLYRDCVNSLGKTEMEPCDKDNCTGTGYKGAECR